MVSIERTLVLVRHGQSEDNELNLFSGWRNPDLTSRGIAEARAAGRKLMELGFHFDLAFTSELRRAQQTLALLLSELGQADLAVRADRALNERDYGELSGLNKAEARTRWSAEQVHLWRKSYDAVPPGGESLAMTAERTAPFYERQIAPGVREGSRILVVAHGNSLRSVVMYLDRLSAEEVVNVHIATGEILIYRFDERGKVMSKSSVLAEVGAS
jgi:2,3-bisphosphoglycerate-dependent phosphoglycerate mutase